MDMNAWLAAAAGRRKALPVLSFPGARFTGAAIDELVRDATLQADCIQAIADRYDMLASVSLMDLSVEAEAFGCPIKFNSDEVPSVTAPALDPEGDVAALREPKVGDARTGTYVETARLAKGRLGKRALFSGAIGPFSLAGRLMDMTEIMVQCLTEPGRVHAVLEKVTAFLTEYYRAFRAAGADGLLMAEPAAGLLSPAVMGQFSTPYVRRLIEAVQTDSFLVVYHNCGQTVPLVPSILETGAKAMHFGNAVDLADIMPRIPADRIVMGNVDPAGEFRHGTPESVRAATLKVLEAHGRKPNFIISSGCDIPPQAPTANIDAFFAAVREFYGN